MAVRPAPRWERRSFAFWTRCARSPDRAYDAPSTRPRESSQMSIDQARVGEHIAAQMEAIERDYGDDCQIGDICTVVEVLGQHGSHVRVRPSDARPHVGVGLLRWAEVTLMSAGRAQPSDDEEEES